MKISFANAFMGYAALSDEHASSSYGIPVLLDEEGNAYGPADRVRPLDDPLGWIDPEIQTAEDLVRRYALRDYDSIEPRSIYNERIIAAKKFLGEA